MDKQKTILRHIFIDGLSGMALGLFSTLIIGTILKQVGDLLGGTFGSYLSAFAVIAQRLTGAGIGIGVAYKFKESTYVLLSAAAAGMIGAYASGMIAGTLFTAEGALLLSGPGEPLGAFVAAYVGMQVGRLVAGRTKLDLLITPAVTILSGGTAGVLIGPGISRFMTWLGSLINWGTEQQPLLMGIVVSVLMGVVLTLPISSAALGIILGLNGAAAGAATIGCCCQMVGFAVSSFRDNGVGGLLAQGVGTSMLQIPNIVRKPLIWVPPTLASAILGPIAIAGPFHMTNNATGSGMGTSGLVGQIMTYQTMAAAESPALVLGKILVFQVLLPALLSYGIYALMRKRGMIQDGDMKLDV
ncbi:MAG: PTS sugar transporter subunit IIC [Eubacteriales bacterium]|nr:PTS sugar transporter subunit IIC [Eubacteriales bacterium]